MQCIYVYIYTYISGYIYIQPIAFGVSFKLNLQSQSPWSLFNGTWEKRHGELYHRLQFENEEMTLQMQYTYIHAYMYGHDEGMEAEQKRGEKRFFGTRPSGPVPNPVRARWLKRLWLVRVTPRADFAVNSVQLCSTVIAIFLCVAFPYKDCSLFLIIADSCRPQKRPIV